MARGKRPDVIPVRDVPRERISERLEAAYQALTAAGYTVSYSTHRYDSGHVDGQIGVEIPRGVTGTKVAIDLEDALGTTRMAGFWFSAGVRYDMAKVEGIDYRRNRGSYDIQVYPQKATSHNFSEVLLILRNRIGDKASATLRRKATSFYARLYWSPDGSRPKRK